MFLNTSQTRLDTMSVMCLPLSVPRGHGFFYGASFENFVAAHEMVLVEMELFEQDPADYNIVTWCKAVDECHYRHFLWKMSCYVLLLDDYM